jgi:hypothetical protein
VRRGYVFAYRLTPKKAGSFTIPAIPVEAEGKTYHTRPIAIRAIEPQETDDLKLRLELSKTACYVGEPVVLAVTFYFARDLRSLRFHLPILESAAFVFDDPAAQPTPGRRPLRVPVNDGAAVLTQAKGTLAGAQYMTLSFAKALIPRQAGTFEVAKASAVCEALVGRRRPRSLFDSMFDDDFFGRGRGVYRKFVIPSNALTLTVRALPEDGRPPGFAGHVGEYRLEAEASPTEVNVGDPITLTLRISGPPYLKNVELPPLQQQAALARDFRIPAERAEGKIEGGVKTFVQTLRATHDKVTELPAIELATFDTRAGAYRAVRSAPIPLTVHPTKVLTARDAEGRDPEAVKTELEALSEGIRANYDDLAVLDNQGFGLRTAARDPLWLALAGLPALGYALLAIGTTVVRRRRADPAAVEARRAYPELVRTLKRLRAAVPAEPCGAVLEALRTYLGRKLRVPGRALTWRDVEGPLRQRGVAASTLDEVEAVFDRCEAGRYAGATAGDAEQPIIERAVALAKELERSLK